MSSHYPVRVYQLRFVLSVRHECHSGAAKRRCPTFNRVDIWKPCGFSVSPPGQMIFRWLFITTCRDATHVSSIIGKCWQKVRCWWGSTTVGEHCWWARFISSQLSGSYTYFIDLWLMHHTWGFQEVIYYYTYQQETEVLILTDCPVLRFSGWPV